MAGAHFSILSAIEAIKNRGTGLYATRERDDVTSPPVNSSTQDINTRLVYIGGDAK